VLRLRESLHKVRLLFGRQLEVLFEVFVVERGGILGLKTFYTVLCTLASLRRFFALECVVWINLLVVVAHVCTALKHDVKEITWLLVKPLGKFNSL
jgi:hypothetical protein